MSFSDALRTVNVQMVTKWEEAKKERIRMFNLLKEVENAETTKQVVVVVSSTEPTISRLEQAIRDIKEENFFFRESISNPKNVNKNL